MNTRFGVAVTAAWFLCLGSANAAAGQDASTAVQDGELELLEQALEERPDDIDLAVERLRVLYLLAVDEEDHIEVAESEIERLLGSTHDGAAPHFDGLLMALEGAFGVLRGKHAFWPHSKIGHVKGGLESLDDAVRMHPEQVEIRYLRLVSTAPLPFLFSRGESVREDVDMLATLLTGDRADMPNRSWQHALKLVVDSEHLSEEAWVRLTTGLAAPSEAANPSNESGALPRGVGGYEY